MTNRPLLVFVVVGSPRASKRESTARTSIAAPSANCGAMYSAMDKNRSSPTMTK